MKSNAHAYCDVDGTERAALREELAVVTRERDALRTAILDIDAHAVARSTDEHGFNAGGYVISIGSLHRALGLIGHTSPECSPEHPCPNCRGSGVMVMYGSPQDVADAVLAVLNEERQPCPHVVVDLDGTAACEYGSADGETRFERLRAELVRVTEERDAWMNGVADVVEPFGFDRETACGPADLLPGLRSLQEALAVRDSIIRRYREGWVEGTIERGGEVEWRWFEDCDSADVATMSEPMTAAEVAVFFAEVSE